MRDTSKGDDSVPKGDVWLSRWSEPAEQGQGTRKDDALANLRKLCRKGAPDRPAEMDLRGVPLAGEDLSGLNLSGYDFSGADLSGTVLRETNLSWARLTDAFLYKANLQRSELLGADLAGANLNECQADQCGFGKTDLSKASLINASLTGSSLSQACLHEADLRAANLEQARMNDSDLTHVSFVRAKLRYADLKGSDVSGASFELTDLRDARLLGIRNFHKANWIGSDIRDLDHRGAYLVRRHIMDENYLYEFRTRSRYHKWVYGIWWLTSDCGRSLGRWALWIFAVTFLFAFLYSLVGVDYGPHETFLSPFYYSVVTLTTLGYGDVVPSSVPAQILAVLQALLGYVGLGGLLSILANKMARRAD